METLYGILSDFHKSSPLAVEQAMQTLKSLGAQRLILNGDITGEQNPHRIPPQYFLQYILKAAADTNLETYVQFGSHEEFLPSEQVLTHHRSLYGNIIDVSHHRRIELPDHHLVFLPGSDVNAGGEYTFGTDLPSGTFLKTKEGLMKIENTQQYPLCAQLLQEQKAEQIFHYENIADLKKHVTVPEKTILLCHVPPLSRSPNGVDYAHFIEMHTFNFEHVKFQYDLDKYRQFHPSPTVAPYSAKMIEHLTTKNIPFIPLANNSRDTIERIAKEQSQQTKKTTVQVAVEKQDNRGNDELADLIKELDITKVINGHFHESVHHAHNHRFQPVTQSTFTDSLLWNASYMDDGKVGILRVNGTQVAYQNIVLNTT